MCFQNLHIKLALKKKPHNDFKLSDLIADVFIIVLPVVIDPKCNAESSLEPFSDITRTMSLKNSQGQRRLLLPCTRPPYTPKGHKWMDCLLSLCFAGQIITASHRTNVQPHLQYV